MALVVMPRTRTCNGPAAAKIFFKMLYQSHPFLDREAGDIARSGSGAIWFQERMLTAKTFNS